MSSDGEGSKGNLADSCISGYWRLSGLRRLTELINRNGVEIKKTEMSLRHCRSTAEVEVYLSMPKSMMEMLQKLSKTI